MKKIVIVIEKSKDFFDGYAENCDGIYGAGDSIQAVKDDIAEAIRLIKENWSISWMYKAFWSIILHSFRCLVWRKLQVSIKSNCPTI